MVYDCFAFFNELDLLELRLNELSPVVDKFVIVEATRTFQKTAKLLYYEENKTRYSDFHHKIIHIIVDEYPNFFTKFRIPNAWDYDNHQKEQIIRGLKDCDPDDIIIISDLDEIPNPDKIKEFSAKPGIKIFEQKMFYYFFNYLSVKPIDLTPEYWRGAVMLRKRDFKTVKRARMYRSAEGEGLTIIKNGGWHFSYLGGVEKIIKKIESIAHTEFNKDYYKDPKRIEEIINSGKDIFDRDSKYKFVPIDESFPAYLRNNISKFEHLIKK
jgi:beta-1,4-mannosyl-glycoprotein beta-1,4-N-acetylglucosaminyltransferase